MKVIRYARYRARNMRRSPVPLFKYTIPINREAVKALNEWMTAIARTKVEITLTDEPIVPTRSERRRYGLN